jgi:hypothetical protein
MRSSQVKSEAPVNSRRTETLSTLVRRINTRRTDAFLEELLNLDVSEERRLNVFWRRFGDFLPPSPVIDRDRVWLDWRQRQLRTAWTQPTALERELAVLTLVPSTLSYELAEIMGKVRPDFEFAAARKWTFRVVDPDLIPREYLEPNLKRIREHVEEFQEKAEIPGVWIYRESPAFVLVLLRALHVVDRMRHCPNAGCPAPYFIARRRSQKYCSDVCALPAQRQFKKDWWNAHRGKKPQRKGGKRT